MRRELQKGLVGGGDGQKNDEMEELEQADRPMAKEQRKQERKEFAKDAKAAGGKKNTKSKQKATGSGDEGGGIEAQDSGEAEEIQLNGFNFSTQLSYSPSPAPQSNPTSEISKPRSGISTEQRADQRARLAARIEALRAKRNADSSDGTLARNRNELMAARRREEAVARKERKKETRLKQKATAEQAKSVTPTLKESLPRSDSREGGKRSPAKDRRNADINPSDSRDKSKGGKGKVLKKANLRKSRPGFEGSLKLGKKGKK